MVLLAKNYHYIEFAEPIFFSFFVFLAGPVAGRPAPGPGSRARPGNIEKHGNKKKNWAGPGRPGIRNFRVTASIKP